MSNVAELKAQLAAVNAEWDARRAAIQGLRAVDRVQNEGGEGFSSYEAAAERLADEYLPRVTALGNEIFAAEWTAEVTVARRAAWNAEMMALSAKRVQMTSTVMTGVVAKLGHTLTDLRRAVALHNIK